MEYDEQHAIDYIRQHSGIDTSYYDDDQILNVIDVIFDYYEDNGMLDISFDEDDESEDVDSIINHVTKIVAKDRDSIIKPEHIPFIVKAEIEYEESLNEF